MVDEQGAAQDSRVSVNDGLKSLHVEQQHIQHDGTGPVQQEQFGVSCLLDRVAPEGVAQVQSMMVIERMRTTEV